MANVVKVTISETSGSWLGNTARPICGAKMPKITKS
jgi:hypothetical protein